MIKRELALPEGGGGCAPFEGASAAGASAAAERASVDFTAEPQLQTPGLSFSRGGVTASPASPAAAAADEAAAPAAAAPPAAGTSSRDEARQLQARLTGYMTGALTSSLICIGDR